MDIILTSEYIYGTGETQVSNCIVVIVIFWYQLQLFIWNCMVMSFIIVATCDHVHCMCVYFENQKENTEPRQLL